VYSAAWVIALRVASALAFALSPKLEGPVPLYLTGPVTASALLLTPPRRWWPYLLLPLPLIVFDYWLDRLPLTPAVVEVVVFVYLIIVCNSAIPVSLLRRFGALPLRFATVGEVTRFVVCVGIGALAGMLIASTARAVVFSWDFWISWQMGYVGYVLRIVIFTPAIVLWLTDGPGGLGLTTQSRRIELGVLSFATVLVGGLVFGTRLTDLTVAHTLIYLLVPLLIWAALRFGPQGLASALTLTSALAITGAVNNRGPFVGASPTANTLALQLFLLFVGVPLYFLAALVQERRHAEAEAERRAEELDRIFEQSAEGLSVFDAEGRLIRRNTVQRRLLGLEAAPPGYEQQPLDEQAGSFHLRDQDGHPLTANEVQRTIQRWLRDGVQAQEVQLRTFDGRELEVSISTAPLRDQAGHFVGAVGILHDQTARRQLEQEHEQARVTAEQRAAQLEAIFEAMADGVAVYDAVGHLVQENAAQRHLLGLDAAPQDYAELALPERMALFAARDEQGRPLAPDEGPLPRVLRGEVLTGAQTLDIWSRTLDGREVELNVSAAPLRDRDGHLAGAVAVFRDQTEQRRLERERAEQADQLDRIFEGMTDALLIYDASGRTIRTNPAARRLLGLDAAPPDYAQLTVSQRLARYAPRDAQGQLIPLEKSASARALRGESVIGSQAMEVQVQTFDGRMVELSATAAPLRDQEGQIIGAVAILHDQTVRNRLEREVAAQAEQLERLFEQIADGLIVYDAEGRIVRENAATRRLLGLKTAPPEYHRLPARERVALFAARDETGRPLAPEDWPLMRILRGEAAEVVVADVQGRTLDGREVEITTSAAPLRDAEGRLVGVVSILHDQTERKRLEREREAANAQLAALQAVTDTALTHLGLDELLRAVLDRIHDVLGLEHAAIRLLEADGRTLSLPTAHMQGDVLATDAPLAVGQGFAGRVAASRAPLVIDDLTGFPFVDPTAGAWLRSAVGVPLLLDERLLGVLYAGTTTPRHFAEHEVDLLQRLADRVAVAIDRARLYEAERRAHAQAAARTAELEAVLNGVTDGVIVYDRDGRGTYVNPALRAASAAYAPPDYGHLSAPERAAVVRMRTPAGEVMPEDELPQARLLRGEVLVGAASPDLLFDTPDGRTLTVQYAGSPLRDEAGTVTGAVMVLRDVTDERRLQRALAEQAEQLERIVEGMGEGLFVYDAEGRAVRTNAAARRLLGLDAAPPDFHDLPIEERLARYAPPEAKESLRQLLSPETWLTLRKVRDDDARRVQEARDIRMRALDGRELEVSASIAPLHDAQGQVVGAVVLLSDRTERNKLAREMEAARASELALREVNERLDTFIAMAAHDLRHPVGVSKMAVAGAQRRVHRAAAGARPASEEPAVPFAQVEAALETTARQIDILWRLVQHLLDFSRVRQGTLVLDFQPCDLEALVRQAVDEQRLLSPARAITVAQPEQPAAGSDGQPLVVEADADRLGQVLTNYLANAVRFSPEDQPIEVVLRRIAGAAGSAGAGEGNAEVVRVEVHDHGPGIALEERAVIWERFQQARTASEAGGGLGLGLYIVRLVVEQHGGQVGVESEVGQGSTFWFSLPLAPTASGAAPASTAGTPSSSGTALGQTMQGHADRKGTAP
jgi:PAS domain S-box-containing protein